MSTQDHATAFSIWAFAIHLNQLSEVRHTLTPDNDELQSFCDVPQCTCIHSLLLNATANMTNPGENLEVIKHLIEGLKQMGEAAEHSNTLKRNKRKRGREKERQN